MTFSTRGTMVTPVPTGLSPAFATDAAKVAQWKGFLRKSRIDGAPVEMIAVCDAITTFLSEPAAAVRDGRTFIRK